MLTSWYEVDESPAKKPESTSEESEEDDDDFCGGGDRSEESDGQSEESKKDLDDIFGDGLHEMTDQEWAIYEEAVDRSDGFDVPLLPNVFAIGIIQPADSGWPAEDIREYAEIAIEDQNEKRKKELVSTCTAATIAKLMENVIE
ncbi:uncharacterized protein A4U43_C09F3620 [Asparagus officinalis]|uniref:Uncharacterized protein n=1 Tax=Asparagus officinalis TaxID=4686 RepID=A0A5P1E533_ASPOF|nr:uncharacterized protein A4U43_C09F3620 [Asparagus officinalis]